MFCITIDGKWWKMCVKDDENFFDFTTKVFQIDNVHLPVSLLPRAKPFSSLLKRLIG